MSGRALLGGFLLAACAAAPTGSPGAVVDSVTTNGRTFVVTQRGLFEQQAEALRVVAAPGLRPFALAARDADGLLLIGGGRPQQSGELCLLAVDGRRIAAVQVADDVVYGVAIAPRDDLAAAACADGAVLLLRLPDLAPTGSLWMHDAPALCVAFSPDGGLLASCGLDGAVRLGAPAPGTAPRVLLDHTSAALCLAWSPDGERLVSGSRDGKIRLHDREGRLLWTWQRLGGAIDRVRCTPGTVCYEIAAAGAEPRRRGELAWP